MALQITSLNQFYNLDNCYNDTNSKEIKIISVHLYQL